MSRGGLGQSRGIGQRISATDLTRGRSTAPGLQLPTMPAWFADAKCAAGPGDDWFPTSQRDAAIEARRLCAGCPVKVECLTYALDMSIPFGVWGGVSERDRRQMQRERAS